MTTKLSKKLSFKHIALLGLFKIFNYTGLPKKYYKNRQTILRLKKHGYDTEVSDNTMHLYKTDNKQSQFLLRIGTSDLNVFNQVIVQQEYEPLVEMVKKRSAALTNLIILDAGANIGMTTLYLHSFFPSSQFICIEAEQSNYHRLIKNVEINALQKTDVLNLALWSNSNQLLCINDSFRDGRNWSKSVSNHVETGSESKNAVQGITLAEVITKYGIAAIDILKIDIEGGEKELFEDETFVRTLQQKVRFLALEIHDEIKCRKIIENKLTEADFEISNAGETTFAYNRSLLMR